MKTNIITLTDSYKFTHHKMYPADTTAVYSYFESRIGATFEDTVFFGLQYLIKEYLVGAVVTRDKIEAAAELSAQHFGREDVFNRPMWEYILHEFDGRLPVRIKAVPEGSPIPVNNVLMTIENLGGAICAPLTNHLETLLTHVWAPSTIASLSRKCKEFMLEFLHRTSDNPDAAISFQLHDFGMRGVSSMESAGIGGAGHLINFLGTDTVIALETAINYYNADPGTLGFSIPATEHSVMTARGSNGEAEVVAQLLKEYPTGLLAMVSDSYNIEHFIDNIIGKQFKEQIINRRGKVIVRPDSLRFDRDTPEEQMVWILECLWKNFGGTINSKGCRVLHPNIGAIWGDGINAEGIRKILVSVELAGFSTENVAFGMGGGLLQKINRDTQRFAFKCSAQERSGEWIDIAKKPLDFSKASKPGRLKLIKDGGDYKTVSIDQDGRDILVTVFETGELVKEYSFDEVRKNAKIFT